MMRTSFAHYEPRHAVAPTSHHAHPFDVLTPDFMMAALESVGLLPDGRCLALNSYENRVYQIGLDDGAMVVAKFYRPGRWSDQALREEHEFAGELAALGIPVVAPLLCAGTTLHRFESLRFAVYPRQGGRWPELSLDADWQQLGRCLGRLHAQGRRARFTHRPELTVERLGTDSVRYLLKAGWLPDHLLDAYESITRDLLPRMRALWQDYAGTSIRIHGDCHLGNVLWVPEQGPHWVDLDDCMMGPAVQDLWMLLSGSTHDIAYQSRQLLLGYAQFADSEPQQWRLIETLRTLRMMHYSAWLARRWDDPAFPRAFPWFGDNKYWERHVLDLREQQAVLDESPLDAVV